MSPRFTIVELVRFSIEAESGQEALEDWLQRGEDAEGYAFHEVTERHVEDERGKVVEVEEEFG